MIFGKDSDDDTVVAMLASALRRDIAFGVLGPDQKLKIEQLRQRYGGSNHSLRETLRLLTAEGLVEATSQRGFRVTSATERDRQDILMIRLQIETLGLSRSLERADIAWEGRVIAAFHSLDHADQRVQLNLDDLTALQWDHASKSAAVALVRQSDSRRLIELTETFQGQSGRFRLARLREGLIDFAARKTRREMLQSAILARQGDAATAILRTDISADLGN